MPPAHQIAARIADGTYPPGRWLPLQRQIAADLGISQPAVSSALTELAAQGIVTRVHRTGHYPGNGPPPPGKPAKPASPPQPRPATTPGQPPSPLDERYITIRELTRMLRVSTMTGYRLCRAGDIDGVIRIGRSYRIPETGARDYLAAIRTAPEENQ